MIQIEKLNKIYNNGKKNAFQALYDIDLEIKDGEMVALVGKSGAGKTTLLHVIGSLDSYEGGSCCVDGLELCELSEADVAKFRNEKIGIIIQDFALVEDFTVEENVSLPLKFSKNNRKNRKERIDAVLEIVGISGLKKKEINKLSGGQKQRVAIARAIVNDPQYILADEPTGALDSKTGDEILDLFKKLNRLGKTVIIITHNIDLANQCDKKILIEDGRVILQ